jgi:hypothetical protein
MNRRKFEDFGGSKRGSRKKKWVTITMIRKSRALAARRNLKATLEEKKAMQTRMCGIHVSKMAIWMKLRRRMVSERLLRLRRYVRMPIMTTGRFY